MKSNILTKCSLFLLTLGLLSFQPLKADSPITSTPFWEAYADVEMVAYAHETGVIDKDIAKFLMSKKTTIQYKAAVVNALGWDFEGKGNAPIYLSYLVQKRKANAEDPDFYSWSAHDLLVYGYLLVMDNYFQPQPAIDVLAIAAEKAPMNYTIRIIHALTQAQKHLDGDWCKVWKVIDDVNRINGTKERLRNAAKKVIMDYIVNYRESCN